MAVYTRFSRVLDAAGHALTVREALALINQVLDEVLSLVQSWPEIARLAEEQIRYSEQSALSDEGD